MRRRKCQVESCYDPAEYAMDPNLGTPRPERVLAVCVNHLAAAIVACIRWMIVNDDEYLTLLVEHLPPPGWRRRRPRRRRSLTAPRR